VLDEPSAGTEAPLLAIKIGSGGRQAGTRRVVRSAAKNESATVDVVAATPRDNVYAAGSAQARGHVGRRRGQLKLLNRLLGDIDQRGADMLVDRIHTIDRDARFSSLASADRDAGVARLGGIEGAAFLNLHAGL